MRSVMISRAATCHEPAKARSGTDNIWMKYPNSVIGQNLPVFSLKRPETKRNPYPSNSPSPATIPTTVAFAPSNAK